MLGQLSSFVVRPSFFGADHIAERTGKIQREKVTFQISSVCPRAVKNERPGVMLAGEGVDATAALRS